MKFIFNFAHVKQISVMNSAYYNKQFKIVFQPKDKTQFNNNRRFAVGAGRLADYIGESNALACFKKADKMKTDKRRFVFRETGIVDFYVH